MGGGRGGVFSPSDREQLRKSEGTSLPLPSVGPAGLPLPLVQFPLWMCSASGSKRHRIAPWPSWPASHRLSAAAGGAALSPFFPLQNLQPRAAAPGQGSRQCRPAWHAWAAPVPARERHSKSIPFTGGAAASGPNPFPMCGWGLLRGSPFHSPQANSEVSRETQGGQGSRPPAGT